MGRHSSTERWFKGRQIEGASAPVSSVMAYGSERVIHFKDGTKRYLTERQLKNVLAGEMSRVQKAAMFRTLRELPDGRASVKVGGHDRGRREVFSSVRGAKAALTRRYGC